MQLNLKAVILFLISTNIVNKAKNVNNYQKSLFDNVLLNSKEVYSEIMSLFENGDEILSDGTIRKVFVHSPFCKTLREYDSNGNLFREAAIEDNRLLVKEGFKTHSDGSKSIAKEYRFTNGNLMSYKEGTRKFLDGTIKRDKNFQFFYGEIPFYYHEGYEHSANGSIKIVKSITHSANGIVSYGENNEWFNDVLKRVNEEIVVKDGFLVSYLKDFSLLKNNTKEIAKKLTCASDGVPADFSQGVVESANGNVKYHQNVKLTNGVIEKIILDGSKDYFGNITASEEFDYNNGRLQAYKADFLRRADDILIGKLLHYDNNNNISRLNENYFLSRNVATSCDKQIKFSNGNMVEFADQIRYMSNSCMIL